MVCKMYGVKIFLWENGEIGVYRLFVIEALMNSL